VKKLPETFTGPNVKQEKECTVKVVLTKRQLEAKEEELTYLQVHKETVGRLVSK
jgi:hypothetical protein